MTEEEDVVEFDTSDEFDDEIEQTVGDLDPDDEVIDPDDESDDLPYDPETESVPDEDEEAEA